MTKLNPSDGIEEYLSLAHHWNIIPNFWLTRDYLMRQKVVARTADGFLWLEEGVWALFPPLPMDASAPRGQIPERLHGLSIWSDFVNYAPGEPLKQIDWEYTYCSGDFRDLSGGNWAVFRKNSRKWQRSNPYWSYLHTAYTRRDIEQLFLRWLQARPPDEEIHDVETMVWFLFEGPNRAFLYTRQDRLVGINVWDLNPPYVIYRYCITDPEEPYLNEFVRLLFYRSLPPATRVIDGGTLGKPGLEQFKDKLNPIRKRPVYCRALRATGEKAGDMKDEPVLANAGPMNNGATREATAADYVVVDDE